MRAWTVAALESQLRDLGVRAGDLVEVHCSFRAIRPVEGGVAGLLAALRAAVGARGTLVMPTMTAGDGPYDPTQTPSLDMGALAEHFWRQPGALRSDHPGASFAAEGPLAAVICAPHPLEPAHGLNSPPGRVYALDGHVLLLGVHHSENTLMHVAEDLAGVPYGLFHPCAVPDGAGGWQTRLLWETDHCCAGFRSVSAGLEERWGPVGEGRALFVRARTVVDAAVRRMKVDPFTFLCALGEGCDACDAARQGAGG